MRYIIVNDLIDCFKNKRKLILGYAIITLIIFLFFSFIRHNHDSLYYTLGLKCLFAEQDWIQMLAYVFMLGFYIYLALLIFIKDLSNDITNIFLRITPRKWLNYKLVSIAIIDIIILSFSYLCLLSLDYFFNGSLSFDIAIIFNHYLYLLVCQLLLLTWYAIFSKSKLVALILLVIILTLIGIYTSIVQIPLIFLIIAVSCTYLILNIINNIFYIDIFEGS